LDIKYLTVFLLEYASTCAIKDFISQRFAGFSLQKEIGYLSTIAENPNRPVAAVIGGKDIHSKIGLLKNLASKVDKLLLGGAMSATFYRAMGNEVGDSFVDEAALTVAKELLEEFKDTHVIVLPVDAIAIPGDLHISSYEAAKLQTNSFEWSTFPVGQVAMDIGEQTLKLFKEELNHCRTIFYNGKNRFVFLFPVVSFLNFLFRSTWRL
jgi:phosphoglycerate kinase